MLTRRGALTLTAGALAASAPVLAFAAGPDKALQAAIAGAWRKDGDRARDVYRHPYESLTFWGLEPGMTVLEINPGGGYWVEILAPYLKATGGRYFAANAGVGTNAESDAHKRRKAAFEARYADRAVYPDITLASLGPEDSSFAPGMFDLVLTARNLHNWAADGSMDRVLKDMFEALKPGGILAFEEHRSDPRPMKPEASDGYMAQDFVIATVEKAGFRLDAKSDINANPKDTKDHPFGVWTLPPVRRSAPAGLPGNPLFDRSKYDAIGESDRMTLRFVKPG